MSRERPTDKPILKTFDQPELMMPVQCNQHNWMRGPTSMFCRILISR